MAPADPLLLIVQTAIFVAFSVFIALGAVTTTARLIRYWRKNSRPPLLLYRDVVARLSLAIPFGAILGARIVRNLLHFDDGFTRTWWWALATGIPAVIGAAIYLYFELFVIERAKGSEERYLKAGSLDD